MDYIILVFWFIFLIKWSDLLVEWASSIAKKFGISALVIWLTIVAFGSSAPELVINVISAVWGNTALAVSNIVGSNISNILLILWVTALISPVAFPQSTIKKEIPFLIFVAVLLMWILSDGIISRIDAGILAVFFAGFLFYTFKISKNIEETQPEEEIILLSNLKSTIYILLWFAGLIGWGKMIVDSAVSIATQFWLPEAFIWVTIVAIGTSLPELAVWVVAALKKQTDIAVGSVVGSNIFNTLWILWATGLISPLPAYAGINIDLSVNIVASILVLLFAFTFAKNMLERKEWTILVCAYFVYIWYLINTVL